MDLIDTLKPYLSKEEIDKLFSSFEDKDTHAVVLNSLKLEDSVFLKDHKKLKKHPFVKHAFIFDKETNPLGKEIAYDQGLYSIQDPSAMLPAYFLNPSPNDIVLDMCASPGGKTIQLALEMQGKGILIANDISYPRAKDLSSNIERMGLGNVIVTSNDFSIAHNYFINKFDKILLDAPCSGSAMFRKNELSKEDWSYKKVENCASIQSQLLEYAYKMLKPGGIICYSTCSFSYEEDDLQVLNFLEKHSDLTLINIKKNKSFTRSKMCPEAVHVLPTHFNGEGQFFCLIKKNGKLTENLFTSSSNKRILNIVKEYGLENRSNEIINGGVYSLSNYFDISHLNVLRYGVKVCDFDDVQNPNHNLSHFLSNNNSIGLTPEQLKQYMHGDTFPLVGDDGFKIVSYRGFNIGYVKIVKNLAKNHYPKGLRKVI